MSPEADKLLTAFLAVFAAVQLWRLAYYAGRVRQWVKDGRPGNDPDDNGRPR